MFKITGTQIFSTRIVLHPEDHPPPRQPGRCPTATPRPPALRSLPRSGKTPKRSRPTTDSPATASACACRSVRETRRLKGQNGGLQLAVPSFTPRETPSAGWLPAWDSQVDQRNGKRLEENPLLRALVCHDQSQVDRPGCPFGQTDGAGVKIRTKLQLCFNRAALKGHWQVQIAQAPKMRPVGIPIDQQSK